MQSSKSIKIRNWVERVASQSSEYEEGQKRSKYKLVENFDLWIELDFDNNNNQVNFYPVQSTLSRWQQEKSVEEK